MPADVEIHHGVTEILEGADQRDVLPIPGAGAAATDDEDPVPFAGLAGSGPQGGPMLVQGLCRHGVCNRESRGRCVGADPAESGVA